jgi:WD40 repeat protein
MQLCQAILIELLPLLLGMPGVLWATARASGDAAPHPTADLFAGLPPDSARLKAIRLKPINEYGADIDAMEPSLSPDGRYVVFSGLSDVFLYDLRTRKTVTLCRSSNAHDFAWNATGTRIAFAGAWNDASGHMPNCIWLVGADGSGLHRVQGSQNSSAWTMRDDRLAVMMSEPLVEESRQR